MDLFAAGYVFLLLVLVVVGPPLLAVVALFIGIGAQPVRRHDSLVLAGLALALAVWAGFLTLSGVGGTLLLPSVGLTAVAAGIAEGRYRCRLRRLARDRPLDGPTGQLA